MIDRRTRAALALVTLLLAMLGSPPAAFGHGDEELAMAPARALVQQALALLDQAADPVEAHERVEAALASDDADDLDLGLVRRAQAAFDRGDHPAATQALELALAPGADTDPEEASPGLDSRATETDGRKDVQVTPEALAHSPEIEPDRGTAEALAVGGGAAAVLLAALGLALGRRRRDASA